nr:MAG TPA: hypothetical protein [Caudoviricetes sp.]
MIFLFFSLSFFNLRFIIQLKKGDDYYFRTRI